MISLIISIAAAFSLIVLTILEKRCKVYIDYKKYHIADCIIFAIGIAGLVLSRILFSSFAGKDKYAVEYDAWLGEDFFLFFRLSLIICIILLFLTTVSCVAGIFDSKSSNVFSSFIQAVFPVLSSVIIIILTIFACILTKNESIKLEAFITAVGISEAFLLRLPYLLVGFHLMAKGRAAQ